MKLIYFHRISYNFNKNFMKLYNVKIDKYLSKTER